VGSAVTFSGFNNIDFNLILNAIMQQASQPLTTLQTHQTALQSQVTNFSTLNAKVSALQSAAKKLSGAESLSAFAAHSSDPTAVAVSSTSAATAGAYDIVVNELARAQVTASTSVAPDATTTIVASGGTLTIGGVAVNIAGPVTLQQLTQTINQTANIGVHAAAVRTGAASYKLVLTGNLTGAANAFTIDNALSGGTGVTFADTDSDNVSGDSPADNAVNATDASILVNNIPVTGTSNTFEDVIPGVTVTAYTKDAAKTIHIDVAADSSALSAGVEQFVTAYNDIVKFLGDQRASAAKGDQSSIGRDPLLRQLSGSLRSELLGAHGAGTVQRLSEIGVEFTSTGTLEINSVLFDDAIAANPDEVRALMGGTGGVFPGVTGLLTSYSASNGFIPSIKDRLNQQIKAMDNQIQAMQARLALQREALQRDFIEADRAMSRLKSQATSLASFGAEFGTL